MDDPTRESAYFDPSSEPSQSPDEEPGAPSGEEDDDAFQEPGPASLDVRQQARYGRTVGEGDAHLRFPAGTSEEAKASLEAIREFCGRCPEKDACPGKECAVYRASSAAIAVLAGDIEEADEETEGDYFE